MLGYNPEQKTSIKALQWIKFQSFKNNLKISHAKNGGELKIGNYLVDEYCEKTQTIYEFHGCFWHGCKKCYKSDTWNPVKKELMGTTFKKHMERINYLITTLNECKLIEIWQCDFDNEKKNNFELVYFLTNICNISEPINPRDALFRGRTNALKLYYKCNTNEQIKYCDFASLYPYEQKYCRYPIGHPVILTENFDDINNYF